MTKIDMKGVKVPNKGKIPKLRFKKFTDEWEVKKLGKVATNKSEKYNPEKATNFIKCIELEHLAGEMGLLLGYTDGSKSGSIKNVFSKGDVLFGKLRPYLKKYLQAPFDGVCSSEIWVLKANSISNDFLYQIVQTNSFIELANQSSGSKMPRADWNVVEKGLFAFPSLPEQQKIASFLSLIDERIQTQNKIIEELKSSMKSLSEQLFSQKLRFKDADGNLFPDWEVKKLGDVLLKNSTKNKELKYSLVQSVSNKYGFINQDEMFEDRRVASKDTSNYYVIEKGCFAYNPSRIDVGSLAYKYDSMISVISPLYISFKSNKTYLTDMFLLNWFSTIQFIFQMNSSFEGSVRNTLSYENLIKMRISFPCLEEQTKIANFLSSINAKIETEKLLLKQLENQKKYLLSNLFI